jgi:NAD(P)H-flavin reductase
MSTTKKTYANGLYAQRNEKAPHFIVVSADIVVDQFTKWLEENKNEKGKVKIDFTKSDDGKFSALLNTYKPKESVDF